MIAWDKRRYRVLVRPTYQGEFLIFPYGYKKHGKGYVFSKTWKDKLEIPVWSIQDTVLLTAIMISLLMMFVAWEIALPSLVGLFAVWYAIYERRRSMRIQAIIPKGRFGGMVLTKERYYLEYASQFSRKEVASVAGLCALLMCGLPFAIMGLMSIGLYMPSIILGMVLCASGIGAWWISKIYGYYTTAFKHGVKAGDPVDVPLAKQVVGEDDVDIDIDIEDSVPPS